MFSKCCDVSVSFDTEFIKYELHFIFLFLNVSCNKIFSGFLSLGKPNEINNILFGF